MRESASGARIVGSCIRTARITTRVSEARLDASPRFGTCSRVSAKRRLPLIQTSAEPETPVRPSWQWAFFGAGLLGLAWLVLSLLASPVAAFIVRRNIGAWSSPEELAARLDNASPAALGRMALENLALQVAVVGAASAAAGVVVGRWGPRKGVAESAAAGALVALVAVALAAVTPATSSGDVGTLVTWGVALLVPWASGLAALGASYGSRDKRQLTGP